MSQLDGNRVSVVVTTYNHAHFLKEALQSIVAQTVRPFEIIVVDDGSTDAPDSVTAGFPDVIHLHQERKGLSAARNLGLEKAAGEFIAFLDADDRLCPGAVSDNLQQFSSKPNSLMVYGGYRNIDPHGRFLQEVETRHVSGDPFRDFLTGNCVGMHGTVLYRRSALLAAGGFDPTLKACEDYDVYLKLSQTGGVASTGACLAEYRRHPGGMSSNIPMMLQMALQVLRRYRDMAQARKEWVVAYETGVRNWKRHYAELQIGYTAKAIRSKSSRAPQFLRLTRVLRAAPRETAIILSSRMRHRLAQWRIGRKISFGELRRAEPFSRCFGYDRGKPIDRRYIEAFLAANSAVIRGRVMEVGDNAYTVQFGGENVTASDVLNRYPGHPSTTLVGDLCDGGNLPAEAFDCIVLTQTLHLLFELKAATASLWRMLKPGGYLLVTVPWVSPIDRGEWGSTWYWSLTPAALQALLSERFDRQVDVTSYGNVYSATAFLYGLAEHELRHDLLDVHDRHCPVIVAARARKQEVA